MSEQTTKTHPVAKLPWHDTWKIVDETSDPAWFIHFLDATREKKRRKATANPEQYFAYLDLHPGHQVLELGCGTGDFVEPLARLVGESGHVVGMDKSQVMITEARKRHPSIEFHVGDAHELQFANNSFDRCFATTVFQHLGDPTRALLELVRVTKPGGKIAITEQDWETLIVDADNKAVTRRILDSFCDGIPNGWIGRQLVGLFHDAGLVDTSITTATFTSTDLTWTEQTLGLKAMVRRAQEVDAVSEAEGSAWLAAIELKAQQSQFFAAFTAFCVIGSKPYPSYY
jgi:ubiquinone/menaquinone biosynthesis C-methylase UbiE